MLARLNDEVQPDEEKDQSHLPLARMLAEGPLGPDFFDFLLLFLLRDSLIVVFDFTAAIEPREEALPGVEVALRPCLGLLFIHLLESLSIRPGLVRLGIMV